MFGGDIGRQARKPDQAGNRGQVDDGAAAALQHVVDFSLKAQECSLGVDPHDGVIVGFRLIGERGDGALDAGIVDRAIESSVLINGACDQGRDIFRTGDIGALEHRGSAGLVDQRDGLFPGRHMNVGHHDIGALSGKFQCRGPADAGA